MNNHKLMYLILIGCFVPNLWAIGRVLYMQVQGKEQYFCRKTILKVLGIGFLSTTALLILTYLIAM